MAWLSAQWLYPEQEVDDVARRRGEQDYVHQRLLRAHGTQRTESISTIQRRRLRSTDRELHLNHGREPRKPASICVSIIAGWALTILLNARLLLPQKLRAYGRPPLWRSSSISLAMQRATSTIPIVFAVVSDPIAQGRGCPTFC